MTVLNEVLREFRGDAERVEHLLKLVKTFRDFGASTAPPAVVDGTAPWPQALSLKEESHQRRTDLPVLSGSLLLYLAGRFEFFIRQVVQILADEIAGRAASYVALPQKLRTELKNLTLEVALRPSRYGFTEAEADVLLSSLVGNQRGTTMPLSISSDVLTITESNMRPKVLADLMKRVGMNDYWQELGKQAKVKLHIAKTVDGEASAEAQSRLNALMEDRNQIAHPTNTTNFPDTDQVLKNAEFLQIIAEVTVEIVSVYLASIPAAAPAPAPPAPA
ncbi:HEPN domain-containing protein, partial [Citrifermentans bremense]|uniref:HEPN domain-containing protein n=1 Tax=Citrifermentans bremense TaxID=60035 RepID=UPI0018DE3B43